jgi:hypothetical protein
MKPAFPMRPSYRPTVIGLSIAALSGGVVGFGIALVLAWVGVML